MSGIKREELGKECKKIRKVRARMVAVRMVQVLDTAGTAPARRRRVQTYVGLP